MEKKEDYEKLYDMLLGYEREIHKKNQKRIRIGLRCLIIIPLIFLALLFWTESSKIVFLILWIVSLFILAGYLIFVEYSDYKLQEKLNEISNREQQERDALDWRWNCPGRRTDSYRTSDGRAGTFNG